MTKLTQLQGSFTGVSCRSLLHLYISKTNEMRTQLETQKADFMMNWHDKILRPYGTAALPAGLWLSMDFGEWLNKYSNRVALLVWAVDHFYFKLMKYKTS